MGRRGPAPTPTAILKNRGSWRGEAKRDEPTPGDGVPLCPEWLSDDAKKVWFAVAAQLVGMNVLKLPDENALVRYCNSFVRWQKAAAFLQENGEFYTLKDEAGKVKCLMPWPQVATYTQMASMLLKLEQEFGLTPSSRSRITVTKNEEQQQQPTGLAALRLAN